MGATFIYNFDIRAIGKYYVIMPKEKVKRTLVGHQTKILKVSRAELWNRVRIEN